MRKISLALSASFLLAAGCDSGIVTNENSPTVDALAGNLTGAGIQTLSLGVLAQDRALIASFAYLIEPEIFARDAYRIDSNEPRYVNETLNGTPDYGSFSGSGGFAAGYTAIRSATTLINALPGADPGAITEPQRLATTGFIKTIKALDYYRLLELRDTIGVAIQTADPNFVAPLSCKANVLDYIASLLDSANTNLTTAGASAKLPFTLPTGFTAYGRNYGVDSNIVKLNRGLKGKVDLYRGLQHTNPTAGAFTAAVAELTQALGGAAPGAVAASTFGNGAYVTFISGGTENTPNPLSDSKIGVNPKAQAALQAGDTRSSKIINRVSAPVTLGGSGLSTTLTYVGSNTANAANQVRPNAILRDEEIVLLRAQAYFELGQFANGAADLNSVRTTYGLAAIAVPTTLAAARTALLYEKRYSLFFEGPQRLVDLRAYGLLKAGITPAELPNDPFNTALPIPKFEADARGNVLTLSCK